MALQAITEAARAIKDFDKLPVTAQISLVYEQIQVARQFSIPLSAICRALNEAGSSVELRYLREALCVVRKRLKASEIRPPLTAPTPPNPPKDSKNTLHQPTLKPSQKWHQKAQEYMDQLDHPFLKKLLNEK